MAASASIDEAGLVAALAAAQSADAAVRAPAEGALQAAAAQPGYCEALLRVVAARRAGGDAERWMAVLCLKNAIGRHWRVRAGASGAVSVTAAEKASVRAALLAALDEPSPQVAVQLAVVVARVARLDFPREWPGAFQALMGRLQQPSAVPDGLLVQRVYLTLHHVLKELASKRLAADQRVFAEVAAQLFEGVWAQWCADTSVAFEGVPAALDAAARGSAGADQPLLLALERWLLALKCLRRLVLHGFGPDARTLDDVPLVRRLVPACMEALGRMRSWRDAASAGAVVPLAPAIEKCTLKALKTVVDLQHTHPWSFLGCLGTTFDACAAEVLAAPEGGRPRFDRLLIHCMTLLQNVLKNQGYRKALADSAAPNELTQRGERLTALGKEVRAELQVRVGADAMARLCVLLVRGYLPLTAEDLEEWEADPEAFAHEQDVVGSKDRLRPCAESLFATVLETAREACAPGVVAMLNEAVVEMGAAAPAAESTGAARARAASLALEAVYNAVGLGEYSLYDYVDFKSLFPNVLVPELAIDAAWRAPVRRRAAWLIGRWVSALDAPMRQVAYGALTPLLRVDDFAVRLAALGALHALCDDWSFEEEGFVPYLAPVLDACFALCPQSTELDTQTRVFALVGVLVERMPNSAAAAADRVVAQLPGAWAASESQPLLRIQVVSVVQRMVASLGLQGGPLQAMIAPVVAYCTNSDEREALSLLEDGLQLWLAVLRNAPTMSPELMALFPNIPRIIASMGFEHLQPCARLLEAYVLLGGAEFLQTHGGSVVTFLGAIVGEVKEAGLLMVLPSMDMMLTLFPADAPALLEGVLAKLVALLAERTESMRAVAEACCVLARVLFANARAFERLLSPTGPAAALLRPTVAASVASTGGLMRTFVGVWLEACDSLRSVHQRKLCSLALCVLLTSADPAVAVANLEPIIVVATGALAELDGGAASGSGGVLGQQWQRGCDGDDEDEDAGEGGAQRLRAAHAADQAAQADLRAALRDALRAAEATHGAAFAQAMGGVHAHVRTQLERALQPPAGSAAQ